MALRDIDIRKAYRHELSQLFADSPSVIVDELSICLGDARIDIAVVNGKMHGFEIKSDLDTLERLPRQAELYNKVFDQVTLVCSEKWIDKAVPLLPDWWGIVVPIEDKSTPNKIIFQEARSANDNKQVDARSLVELLWKEEALDILSQRGLDRGVRSKPRWDIWDRMVERMDYNEIKLCVREYLKKRQGWREVDSLQKICVD